MPPRHYFLNFSKSESEVAQSCLTLFDHKDCSLPGSSVHGILQARVLEWVAAPRDHPDPGIELRSLELQADFLSSEPPGKPLAPPEIPVLQRCHPQLLATSRGFGKFN